jgi:type I restriction enzyme S subunit
MDKQKDTPDLRFPEFKEEWKREKLGEVTSINPANKSLPEKFIYIDLESVSNGELLKENEIIKENAPSRAQRVLKENDVLFQMVRPYQMNNLFFNKKGNYVASTGYAQIRTEQVSMYLFQYLHYSKFVDSVIEKCTGTSYPAINSKDLANITISFPIIREQTKIASIFTTIDGKIQSLKKKKELLEIYKKGVMQKLFSQEIRLKDDNGNEFPDWEEKMLKEIAVKRISKNKENEINLVFTNSAMKGIVNQRDFFDKDIANQNNLTGYYLVEKDDFVYNPRISSFAPVGPISRNGLGTGIMSPLYSVFRFIEGNLNYLEYFFNTSIWHLHIENISNSGARADRMSFLSADFYEMPIPFPSSQEQFKIYNFLSTLDDKINKVGEQIDKVTDWKKGLLQKMFV